MKLSIITLTLGTRKVYLDKQVQFIMENILEARQDDIQVEHFVVQQGGHVESTQKHVQYFGGYSFEFIHFPENIGIGEALNRIVPKCTGDFILKLDDDAIPINPDFLEVSRRICNRFPDSVWSPYPVGLINNPGGPKGYRHAVYHSGDRFFTMRFVGHVGGFARFAPTNLMKQFKFQNDLLPGVSGNEDGQFSSFCNSNGIKMFYLENGCVVEHAESTLGQIARFPEYFQSRTYESQVQIEVITDAN